MDVHDGQPANPYVWHCDELYETAIKSPPYVEGDVPSKLKNHSKKELQRLEAKTVGFLQVLEKIPVQLKLKNKQSN